MGCGHAAQCCSGLCGSALRRCLGSDYVDPLEDVETPCLSPRQLGRSCPDDDSSDGSPSKKFVDPRSLTAILEKGAHLHGYRFEVWEGQNAEGFGDACFRSGDGGAFHDPDGLLELSAAQRRDLQAWYRFEEVCSMRAGETRPSVFAGPPLWSSIRQGMVTDCSLISALTVLAEYEQRFGVGVLRAVILPAQGGEPARAGGGDPANHGVFPRPACLPPACPAYSPSGWYGCRLFLNGATRKVVVDDLVPVGRGGRILCAHSARDGELWVSLLEKAMAKITGGSYEMDGSNPGIDTFHLTGWLPESTPLGQQSDQELDSIFDSFLEGRQRGHCVVCVGTSRIADAVGHEQARRWGYTEGVSTSTGLVANHAYPVLDLRSVGGTRLLLLKNPWGRVRWRGRWSPGDQAWRANGCVLEAVGSSLTTELGEDDGLFWIEWRDVVRYFSHLYLNWSPRSLAPCRLEVHGRWDARPHFARSALLDDADLLAFDPQFALHLEQGLPRAQCAAGADLWVLMSGHIRGQCDIRAQFRAVSVYTGSGRLCCPPDGLVQQGIFSNSECVPLRLCGGAAEGATDLVIVVSQHQSKVAFNFTLQIYSPVPAALRELPPFVPEGCFSGEARGQWTSRTAGGSTNQLWSFFKNPQWYFEVPEGGLEVFIAFLECPSAHTVNMRLFCGHAANPQALGAACSSGMYRRSCGVLRLKELLPGPYVLVLSTFRPDVCAQFRLAWHSFPQPVWLRPQPHPFCGALPHPLWSFVQEVQLRSRRLGQHTLLTLSTRSSEREVARVSVRLQSECDAEDLPPELALHQVGEGGVMQPVALECLDAEHADLYFEETGATVILLARISARLNYVLEVWAEDEDAPVWGRRSAKVIVCSDQPLVVSCRRRNPALC